MAVEKFSCGSIKNLGLVFYLVLGLVFVLECSFSPFMDNANDILVVRSGFSYRQAGSLMFVPMAVSCLATPAWAFLDQRFLRKRKIFLLISAAFGLSMVLQLAVRTADWPLELLALVMLGVGMAGNYTVLSGAVPLIVAEESLGTAFGLLCSTEALAMSLSPLLTPFLIALEPDRA